MKNRAHHQYQPYEYFTCVSSKKNVTINRFTWNRSFFDVHCKDAEEEKEGCK